MELLNLNKEKEVKGNEAITIATVAAILSIAILSIVVWKLLTTNKGSVSIPGGFKFEWSYIKNAFLDMLK